MYDVEHLKIPTLFINSLDDLLSPIDSVDLTKCIYNFVLKTIIVKNNKNIILILSTIGGHVCWFTGFFRPKRWFMSLCTKYFEALETLDKDNNNDKLFKERIKSNSITTM